MNARTRREQLTIGAFWVGLTLVFEIALGRATGDNPLHGGLLLLGLAFMFIAPLLTRRSR
jgi:hypothetical protein